MGFVILTTDDSIATKALEVSSDFHVHYILVKLTEKRHEQSRACTPSAHKRLCLLKHLKYEGQELHVRSSGMRTHQR